jgi:hypothetical protein
MQAFYAKYHYAECHYAECHGANMRNACKGIGWLFQMKTKKYAIQATSMLSQSDVTWGQANRDIAKLWRKPISLETLKISSSHQTKLAESVRKYCGWYSDKSAA